MKPIYRYFTLIFAVMMGACSSGSSIEDDLRTAEMALANGDMRAAESATQHVVGSENFSGLTSKQLARLSLIYIQMADSLDRETNVGQAANCYRRAYEADRDSAADFFSTLESDQIPYAMLLRALSQPRDSVWSGENDIFPLDSLVVDSIN